MDPTITAAWISGGVGAVGIVSTAVTAWIGSRNTRKATEQAIRAGADNTRATLTAAREDRLWERRAAAYEEMLAVILKRKHLRGFELVAARIETDSEVEKFLDKFALPGTFETESRLVAYASEQVLTAYKAADGWHRESVIAAVQLNAIRKAEESGRSRGEARGMPSQARVISTDELNQALDKANRNDQALIDVIRDELRSKPEAALPPPTLPVMCRWFWRRKAVNG